MPDEKRPQIDLIANLIVRRGGEILFVQHEQNEDAWWLPGEDLQPYEHPDDRAKRVLEDLGGLKVAGFKMTHVESFRGRRGWHVMFNYLVDVTGECKAAFPTAWHKPENLPRTRHGKWEHDQVRAALGV